MCGSLWLVVRSEVCGYRLSLFCNVPDNKHFIRQTVYYICIWYFPSECKHRDAIFILFPPPYPSLCQCEIALRWKHLSNQLSAIKSHRRFIGYILGTNWRNWRAGKRHRVAPQIPLTKNFDLIFYCFLFYLLFFFRLPYPSPSTIPFHLSTLCLLFIGLWSHLVWGKEEHPCSVCTASWHSHSFFFRILEDDEESQLQVLMVHQFPAATFKATNWVMDDLKNIQQREIKPEKKRKESCKNIPLHPCGFSRHCGSSCPLQVSRNG